MTPLDRAYVAAGYVDSPWARYNASKLANRPEVAARINEFRQEFQRTSGIYAEHIQRKLLPLVEANARDLFEEQADLFPGERLKQVSKSGVIWLPRSVKSNAIARLGTRSKSLCITR